MITGGFWNNYCMRATGSYQKAGTSSLKRALFRILELTRVFKVASKTFNLTFLTARQHKNF